MPGIAFFCSFPRCCLELWFVNRDNSVIQLLLSITLSWYICSVGEKYFPRCYKSFLLPPFALSPWFWGRPHCVDKSSSDSQLSSLYLPRSRITGLYSQVSWDWDERAVLWLSLGVSNTTHESAPPSVLRTEDVARVWRDSLIALQMLVRVVALMLSARAPLTYGTSSMLCGNMEMQAAVSSILFGDLQIFEANINRFSLWKRRMYVWVNGQEPILVTQVNSFTKKRLFSWGMYKYLIKSQIQ